MRVRKLTTFAALAVAASLSLTACNGDDVASGDSSSASSTGGGSDQSGGDQGSGGSDSAGKSSGGQEASTGSGSNGGGGAGGTGKCRTDALDISASDSTIDGDPEGSVTVEMKNGGDDCVLSGFAGVDLKTSEGSLSAQRKGQPAERTVLKSGKSTFFYVSYPMNDSGGSGVKVTGLVVTPPGETKSFSTEWPGAATLPVTDGSGSPVNVGPIGSAGQGGAQ
ncbi:DUF4232 domain-containing protein [Streptomyces sp. NPDC087300]|uniref:DUF4232 domain-containing protein n=1 Tax=Streptomyces sp. NPDC087300 TaxID=3365780 RepID=UPI0038207276